MHTLALVAHLPVDPEPSCHDGCGVDVMIDLKGSGENIEKIQGLPVVVHDPWGILLHADNQAYLAVSLFRHEAREIGGFTGRRMVSDAAVDVPARFVFAAVLHLDLNRREEDGDGARRQKGIDQDLGRRDASKMIEALLFGTKPSVVVNEPVDQLRCIERLELAARIVGCGNDQRALDRG